MSVAHLEFVLGGLEDLGVDADNHVVGVDAVWSDFPSEHHLVTTGEREEETSLPVLSTQVGDERELIRKVRVREEGAPSHVCTHVRHQHDVTS